MTSPFRHHWLLDPAVAFLNHGSFGACPRVVLEKQRALREEMEREPVQFLHERLPARLDHVRTRVATLLGALAEDLVLTSNASEGVNAVLRSLHLAPGDEILVTDQGYAASRNAAAFVCQRSFATLRVAHVPFPIDAPEQVTHAIVEQVTDRTRLAMVDHITSITGLVWPIEHIVQALAERGVDTLVDAAHAPGMVDIDLSSLGAAYYAANFHKWCCAPKGAAALWVRRDLQGGVFPGVISHGFSLPEASRFHAMFDWTGTRDPTPWLCVPAALEFLEGLCPGGLAEQRAQNRALALYARSRLCEEIGTKEPAPAGMIGSLSSVPLAIPARQSSPSAQLDLYYGLLARGFEALVQPWPDDRSVVVRVSAQLYNEAAEFDAFARALGRELAG